MISKKTALFIQKARSIHGDKYDYSKVEYVRNDIPVCIICPIHGEFWQKPIYHTSSKCICPKCAHRSTKYTQEEFIERARAIHGDKYDYSDVVYKNINTKVLIKCSKHGGFWQKPLIHLSNSGCPQCGVEKNARKRMLTKEDFIRKANEKHKNKYDYSKVVYLNSKTDVIVVCPEHGPFNITPARHICGVGCEQCLQHKRLNTAEFIAKARAIHGDEYDYSQTEYINSNVPVTIICKKHGAFKQKPIYHTYNKSGCPVCYGTNGYTRDDFIVHSRQVHGDKYDYSLVQYTKAKNKVKIICPSHGVFLQRAYHHTKGAGCPICCQSKLENQIEKVLNEQNIEFEKQKRFKWLGKQSLDFYLPRYKIAVECQGAQHFSSKGLYSNSFVKNVKLDEKKFDQCKENQISILYYTLVENVRYCELELNHSRLYAKNLYFNEGDLLAAITNLRNSLI